MLKSINEYTMKEYKERYTKAYIEKGRCLVE